MNERIAQGSIELDLNDADVIAGLRAVDSQFDRTMSNIEHKKAVAKVDADLRPLERQLERAKRQVREFEGLKATAKTDADIEKFQAKIDWAKRQVKELDGQVAKVQLRVEGDKEFHRQLSESNNLLYEQERAAKRAAKANNQRAREAAIGLDREVGKVLRLQKEYANLTDKLERLAKKRPIGREARAKVELDTAMAVARMAELKATLSFMGAHPPVEIKADVDRRGIGRVKGVFADLFSMIGQRAASLSDLTLRLGPFTGSVKQFAVALSFLGPTITDLLGGAGALVGVLGSGISGAAALGAGGVVAMAGGFLGLKFAMRNTGQEIKQARTSINALQSAQLKYGKDSDKAKAKQEELNNVYRQISPLARETAKGIEKFYAGWDKRTEKTQHNLGHIAREGFKALNDVGPAWAKSTNDMTDALDKSLVPAFHRTARVAGPLMSGIMDHFTAQIPSVTKSVTSIGLDFLRIGAEGSKSFGVLSGGLEGLADRLHAFTTSDEFGDKIKEWVTDAQDLMRFFGAAGRVIMHFFGAGSASGDRFVRDMTRGLNKWDDFLTSDRGRDTFSHVFDRAVDGAEKLWAALAPVAGAFLEWSSNLSPVVTGFLTMIGYISDAVSWLTRLTGMGGPLTALGATIGALWAVGKAATFVSFLERAVILFRDLAKARSLAGIGTGLRGLFSGGGGIVAAGTTVATEIGESILAAGTTVAGEFAAAISGAGTASAVENGIGSAAGGAKRLWLPATAAAEEAEVAAGGAATAIGGLGITAAGVATGGVALLGAGLIALAYIFGRGKDADERLRDALKARDDEHALNRQRVDESTDATNRHIHAVRSLNGQIEATRKRLKETKEGTLAHADAEDRLYRLEQRRAAQIRARKQSASEDRAAADADVRTLEKKLEKTRSLNKEGIEAEKLNRKRVAAYAKEYGVDNGPTAEEMRMERERINAIADAEDRLRAARVRAAAASLNERRAAQNMPSVKGNAAQQLGKLALQHAPMAQKIALKYERPADVGRIAAEARRALAAGVGRGVVLKIMADSKNAEQALHRLNRIELKKKMQQLGISGHNGVLSKLSEIDQKQIRAKIAKIQESGHRVTMAKLAQIISTSIPQKTFSINSRAGQALLQLQLVASGLSALQSKSIVISVHRINTITTVEEHRGHAAGGIVGFASGGRPDPHIIRAAQRSAESRGLQTTLGGLFRKPTLLVGEESGHDEYVIATNPQYRDRNVRFLRSAAADFGMSLVESAAGGKPRKPKAKHKPTHAENVAAANAPQTTPSATTKAAGPNSAPNKKRHLAYATDYQAAAVPLDAAQSAYDRAQKQVDSDKSKHSSLKSKMNSLDDQIKTAKTSYDQAKAGSNAKTNAKTRWDKLKKDRKDAHDEYTKLVKESPGHVKDRNTAKKHLSDLKAINAQIDHLNSRISTDKTLMDNAATRYEDSQSDSDLNAWTRARNDRTTAIGLLQPILKKALKLAKSVKGPGQQGWIDQLVGDIAGLDSTAYENSNLESPEASTEHNLEWLLEGLGLTGSFKKYTADLAVAKTNNVDDDPGTSVREDLDSLGDDKTAAQGLMDTLTTALAGARATGDNDLITEAAGALASAQDEYKTINQAFSDAAAATGPSQADLMDTSRAALYREYGSNLSPNVGGLSGPSGAGGGGMQANVSLAPDATGAATASAAGAPSFAGVAGAAGASSAAPSKTVNVTNNYAVPPEDPHTWSAGVNFELGAMV